MAQAGKQHHFPAFPQKIPISDDAVEEAETDLEVTAGGSHRSANPFLGASPQLF